MTVSHSLCILSVPRKLLWEKQTINFKLFAFIASCFPPPHWKMENSITNKEPGKVLFLCGRDLITGVNSTNICAMAEKVSQQTWCFLAPGVLGAHLKAFHFRFHMTSVALFIERKGPESARSFQHQALLLYSSGSREMNAHPSSSVVPTSTLCSEDKTQSASNSFFKIIAFRIPTVVNYFFPPLGVLLWVEPTRVLAVESVSSFFSIYSITLSNSQSVCKHTTRNKIHSVFPDEKYLSSG